MRMRGAPLPAGWVRPRDPRLGQLLTPASSLPEHFYSRLMAGSMGEVEFFDVLARQSRPTERRSPPDDATGEDRRRTRQRRTSPSPGAATSAATAPTTTSTTAATAASSMPTSGSGAAGTLPTPPRASVQALLGTSHGGRTRSHDATLFTTLGRGRLDPGGLSQGLHQPPGQPEPPMRPETTGLQSRPERAMQSQVPRRPIAGPQSASHPGPAFVPTGRLGTFPGPPYQAPPPRTAAEAARAHAWVTAHGRPPGRISGAGHGAATGPLAGEVRLPNPLHGPRRAGLLYQGPVGRIPSLRPGVGFGHEHQERPPSANLGGGGLENDLADGASASPPLGVPRNRPW